MSLRVVATIAVLFLPGCGYTLVQGGSLFDTDEIAVVPFIEDEPAGVAADIAVLVAERLRAFGIRLTGDKSATTVLDGHVISLATVAAPTSGQTIPLYRVRLRLSAALRRGKELLWQTDIVLDEDFLSGAPSVVVGQPELDLVTEANRREALVRITRKAAQQICERLQLASSVAPKAGS